MREDLTAFLMRLSRDLSLDAHTRKYLAYYITQARRQIEHGRSVLFGPETTIDDLAAEGAYQGLLDPKRKGDATGVVLRQTPPLQSRRFRSAIPARRPSPPQAGQGRLDRPQDCRVKVQL